VLTHAACREYLSRTEEQALAATVRAAGLGRGALCGDLLAKLMGAVDISERTVEGHLSPVTPRPTPR
jgi:hypothetical protein